MDTQIKVKDPVCGMEIDPTAAAGSSEYGGQTYHFCSSHCKATFDADPAAHAAGPESPVEVPAGASRRTSGAPDGTERVSLPISGMSCASCAVRIEKTLNRTEGVREAVVNFASQ